MPVRKLEASVDERHRAPFDDRIEQTGRAHDTFRLNGREIAASTPRPATAPTAGKFR